MVGYVLAFSGGLIAGLAGSVFFILGLTVRRNIETTGNISGKVEPLMPILRTEGQEAELEERLRDETRRR